MRISVFKTPEKLSLAVVHFDDKNTLLTLSRGFCGQFLPKCFKIPE